MKQRSSESAAFPFGFRVPSFVVKYRSTSDTPVKFLQVLRIRPHIFIRLKAEVDYCAPIWALFCEFAGRVGQRLISRDLPQCEALQSLACRDLSLDHQLKALMQV
jgi:hypothetical protein